MTKEWHIREGSLYEFYGKDDDEKYRVPSFIQLKPEDFSDEYYIEKGFTTAHIFAYWNFNNGDPTWDPMPEHVTKLDEAKAYTLFMWRMS